MTDAEPTSVARGFLFADLRNYSAWVESHGDHAAAALLREYRALVRKAVAEFHGAEIKTEGDSFYVVFGSPSAAVTCGLRILELAAESRGAAGEPIAVGLGVHAGETVATDEGYVGSVVNVAARVCAQAAAGELLVTDAVRSLTRTYLDVTFVPRGRKRLKGSAERVGIYRVTPGSAAGRAPASRLFAGRRRSAAAALAIALVVLVSALVGGALIRESLGGFGTASPFAGSAAGRGSAATAPSATAEAAFPTAEETKLLRLIPDADRERCQRANLANRPVSNFSPRTVPSVEAGIECDLGGFAAPNKVWFWNLHQGSFRNADSALHAQAGVAGATPGNCRQSRPSIENWTFGGASGQLLCYETSTGDAVLVWTYEGSQLYGKAVRSDGDMAALLNWWEKVGRFAPS